MSVSLCAAILELAPVWFEKNEAARTCTKQDLFKEAF